MTLIQSSFFVPETRLKQAGGFRTLFGNDHPLALEIGCGIGDFVVQIAARQPERNFIAIDIFNQGCRQTCARIEQSGLTNILMMRIEARYLMHRHLGEKSLSAIYINCPDPWPKKRQRKRRLFNHEFTDLALHCLEDGGRLNFCTDFADYGETVAAMLSRDKRFENLSPAAYTHDLGDYPTSKYMRRFLSRGEPIYLCRYRKKCGIETAAPKPNRGFRMRWPKEDECNG